MLRFLLLMLFSFSALSSYAQCVTTINTFPYFENFEVGTANWTSGGVSSDWAWGTPNKGFIQNAASGTKCWVTGGTNGSFYNFGQRSYVTSPCFDFTNIQYPHIKMKIYWEGENQYDGTTFQYSLNSGTTWNNVGTNTDPVDCLNENWFNQGNINALNTLANPKHGWAGTIQPTMGSCFGGNGSGGWVTAQHCMNYLAGQPSVMFRFAFGAGTVCNDFDGFAFDDIEIGNAPSNSADFTSACTINSLEYQFTNNSAYCPTNFNWNFGDPLSGAANLSNSINPTHVFSSPGTYTVTLTVAGPCNQSSTITKTIVTLNTNLTTTNPTCANQSNGSITTSVSGNSGVTTFTLQPGNMVNTNGLFSSLGGGSYTITCQDANGCSLSNTATLTTPPAINWTLNQYIPITCFGAQNGQINTNATGGTGILNYNLQPGNLNNTTGNFTSLGPATYTVTVTDINNCSLTTLANIAQPNQLTITNVTSTNLTCFNSNDGSIQILASGGNGGLTYLLTPGSISNTTGSFSNLAAGTYTISVSDLKGCSSSTIVIINNAASIQVNNVLVSQPGCVPGNDGTITIQATGGTGNLQYSIGGVFTNNTTFSGLMANTYTITIKDANNCTLTTTATLQNPNAPMISDVVIQHVKCFGLEDGSLTVTANGIVPVVEYRLQPGNKTNSLGVFTNLLAGIYTIQVSDANGCTRTSEATITEPSELLIDKYEYQSSPCGSGSTGTLKLTTLGGTGTKSYLILPTNVSNQTGEFIIKEPGKYSIKVTDANECFVVGTFTAPETICCGTILVPNAFSPNNDNRNDELHFINLSGNELIRFSIFNRWGQEVFSAQHSEDRWDGKFKGQDADVGTYYYLLEYKCLSNAKKYVLKGDILLVR